MEPSKPKVCVEELRQKGMVACAECRRLKIKCDRKLPCTSCIQRNKAGICPNGELSLNQANRFIISSTAPLHTQVEKLGKRIQDLENAISEFQPHSAPSSFEPHPLLRPELLKIKHPVDALTPPTDPGNKLPPLPDELLDSFGTLTIGPDGTESYLGRSAGAESLIIEETQNQEDGESIWTNPFPDLYRNIPRRTEPCDHRSLDYIYDLLPSHSDAIRLAHIYLTGGVWVFQPVSLEQILTETLPLVYQYATSIADRAVRLEKVSPHKVALLFAVFSLAALIDSSVVPFSDTADRYYHLARISLSLKSIFESREIETVQTFSLLSMYHGNSPRYSTIATWNFSSFASKLAHGMGMHRDFCDYRLRHSDVQRRRLLFWELVSMEAFYSIALGRPGSINMAEVDCPFPEDRDQILDHNLELQPGYLRFKHEFVRDIFASMVDTSEKAPILAYDAILELGRQVDRKIPPFYLEISESLLYLKQNYPMVSQASLFKGKTIVTMRSITIINIHRPFFAMAITDHPEEPLKSQYAPSFLAGFRAASQIIAVRKSMHSALSAQSTRTWTIWSYLFTAAIVLGCIPLWCPASSFAPAAFKDFLTAIDLFHDAAGTICRARHALRVLERLRGRTEQVFMAYQLNKTMPSIADTTHITLPELQAFVGRTKVIRLQRSKTKQDSEKQLSSSILAPEVPVSQPTKAVVPDWNIFDTLGEPQSVERQIPFSEHRISPLSSSSAGGGRAVPDENHPRLILDNKELSALVDQSSQQPQYATNDIFARPLSPSIFCTPTHLQPAPLRGAEDTSTVSPASLVDLLFYTPPAHGFEFSDQSPFGW